MKKSEFLRFRTDIETHRLLMQYCDEQGMSVSQTLRKLLVRELMQNPVMITAEAPKFSSVDLNNSSLKACAEVLANLLVGQGSTSLNAADHDLGDGSVAEMTALLDRFLQILLSWHGARLRAHKRCGAQEVGHAA